MNRRSFVGSVAAALALPWSWFQKKPEKFADIVTNGNYELQPTELRLQQSTQLLQAVYLPYARVYLPEWSVLSSANCRTGLFTDSVYIEVNQDVLTAGAYELFGRRTGCVSFKYLMGAEELVDEFVQRYGDVCNAHNNQLIIEPFDSQAVSAGDIPERINVYNVVLSSFVFAVDAEHTKFIEHVRVMATDVETPGWNQWDRTTREANLSFSAALTGRKLEKGC